MLTDKSRQGFRRKILLQGLLWGIPTFLIVGAFALAQDVAPESSPAAASQEVIEEIVETPQSLPVPDPTPSPSKTPDTPTAESADNIPALNPPTPLRAADVQFPTPPGAPTNEPLVMIGRPVAKTDYGSGGNLRASQLRSMPPQNFTFDRSALRDVFRLLAEEAGIPYVGIPEHSPKAQRLVTFRMTASPFAALESLARQNDIQLTHEDGVWFMRIRDSNLDRVRAAEKENELIGVVYQLKYDPVDIVDFKGGGGGGGGGSGGAGATSVASPQLPLQNSQRVFEAKAPRIVNEIRIMLGMKPLEYGEAGTVSDPETVAGTEVQSASIPAFD